MNVIAMVPARMGSERLPVKNLALLDGKPLISYAINAAKDSGVFSKVVINADGDVFQKVADRYGVDFYLRPEHLGSSETKSDDVVYDFMQKFPCDIVAWVNPISPLQTPDEVARVINHFEDQGLDSLITVNDEKVHCLYEGQPLNFVTDEIFAKTQDLVPVQSFVYSIMMWRCRPFMENYREKGYALMSGKMGYYAVSKQSGIIIKTDEDLMMAESLIKAKTGGSYQIKYDELAPISR
jgi:CMP-N-acetylneuraminic acid synthetase